MKKLLLLVGFIFISSTAISQVSQIEKDALMALYNSTNGALWTNNGNWLSSSTVSTWHGVTVSNIEGQDYVTSIDLSNNNLNGTLPTSVGDFSKLQHFIFVGNQDLSGEIPVEIGNLSELKDLQLWACPSLAGILPSEIGNLTNLETLSIEDTQITGNIPSTYGNLTALRYFWLSNNKLSGTIPDIFSSMPLLTRFALNGNEFVGEVKLCGNDDLNLVWLHDNLLTSVDLRNGNNANISNNSFFNVENNPNLTNVYVDDVNWSTANWTKIDATTTFSESTAVCVNTLNVDGFESELEVQIYPNPTSGLLNFKGFNSLQHSEVFMTNLLGQKINKDVIDNRIDLSDLHNGIYLLNIRHMNGTLSKFKIIKQ